jgi:rhamnulokinase
VHLPDQAPGQSGGRPQRVGVRRREALDDAAHEGGIVVRSGVAALGNVLVQARAAGAVDNGLDALRDLVRRTHDLQTFEPAATGARLS